MIVHHMYNIQLEYYQAKLLYTEILYLLHDAPYDIEHIRSNDDVAQLINIKDQLKKKLESEF